MLVRYLQSHFGLEENPKILNPMDLSKNNSNIPNVIFIHGNKNPLTKSPKEITASVIGYNNKKFIQLVRDPRDVLVSTFFERTKRGGDLLGYKGTISEFLQLKKGSLDTLIRFYNLWATNRSKFKEFLLIKYEDMVKNPNEELTKILKFVGIENFENLLLNRSVEFGSFKNMKKMESSGEFENAMLTPKDPNDTDSFKTRRGKVGGYVDYFNKDDIDFINMKIQNELDPYYGY